MRSANEASSTMQASNTKLDEQRVRARGSRDHQAIDAVKQFRDAEGGKPELKNTPALDGLGAPLEGAAGLLSAFRARLQSDIDTSPESLARLAQASSDAGNLTEEIGDKQDSLRGHVASQAIWESLARLSSRPWKSGGS